VPGGDVQFQQEADYMCFGIEVGGDVQYSSSVHHAVTYLKSAAMYASSRRETTCASAPRWGYGIVLLKQRAMYEMICL
jgi:hypothetical protein